MAFDTTTTPSRAAGNAVALLLVWAPRAHHHSSRRFTMMRRIAVVASIALALATTAWAQDTVTGRVKFYDPASRVLTLDDGRIVHLEPGSTITVGGRRVTVDTLTPGTTVSVQQIPVAAPSTTVVTQPWTGHPP